LIDREELLKEGVLEAARLMALSAVTAPKARGVDNVVVRVLHEPGELEALAKALEEMALEYEDFFARDAESVRKSSAVLLVGCRVVPLGLKQPKEYKADVDLVMSLINLGIAVGSAVKTASLLNVDNRVMYTVGLAAQRLGLVDADYVIGVPLSASAKSPYFDRKWPPRA